VAERHPTRSESLQPHAERSSRPGSEPPSVEADVYAWRYALLVVHARKEVVLAVLGFCMQKPLSARHEVTWCSGNNVGRINEVTPCQARLVPGWVTTFGWANHLRMQQSTKANSASYPMQEEK